MKTHPQACVEEEGEKPAETSAAAATDVERLIEDRFGIHSEEMQGLLAEMPTSSDIADEAASECVRKRLDEEVMHSWLSERSADSETYDLEQRQLKIKQLELEESDMEEFPAEMDDLLNETSFVVHKNQEREITAESDSDVQSFTSQEDTQNEKGDDQGEYGKYLKNTLESIGEISSTDLNELYASPARLRKSDSNDHSPENRPDVDSEYREANSNEWQQQKVEETNELSQEETKILRNFPNDGLNHSEQNFNVTQGDNIQISKVNIDKKSKLTFKLTDYSVSYSSPKETGNMNDELPSSSNELTVSASRGEENIFIHDSNNDLICKIASEPDNQNAVSECLQKIMDVVEDLSKNNLDMLPALPVSDHLENIVASDSKTIAEEMSVNDFKRCKPPARETDASKIHFPTITSTLNETGKILQKIQEGITDEADRQILYESAPELSQSADVSSATKSTFSEVMNELESKNRKDIFTLRHSDGDSFAPRISEGQAIYRAVVHEERRVIDTKVKQPQGKVNELDSYLHKTETADVQFFPPEESMGFENVTEEAGKTGVEIPKTEVPFGKKTPKVVEDKPPCMKEFVFECPEQVILPREEKKDFPDSTSSNIELNTTVLQNTQPDQDEISMQDPTNQTSSTFKTMARNVKSFKSASTFSSLDNLRESKLKNHKKISSIFRCLRFRKIKSMRKGSSHKGQ